MKKTYMIRFFLIVSILLISVYYIGFQLSSDYIDENQLIDKNTRKEAPLKSVDTNKQETITNKTKYILETYDSKNYTLSEEELSPPADFIGLTRAELLEYLQKYEKAPNLSDLQKGFQSFKLLSFSSERIVLRKTYCPYAENYKYYLVAENGMVTVYYIDKKTVYEYTDIQLNTLPQELQTEIESGKCIKDTEELYNFLENYSS